MESRDGGEGWRGRKRGHGREGCGSESLGDGGGGDGIVGFGGGGHGGEGEGERAGKIRLRVAEEEVRGALMGDPEVRGMGFAG